MSVNDGLIQELVDALCIATMLNSDQVIFQNKKQDSKVRRGLSLPHLRTEYFRSNFHDALVYFFDYKCDHL